MGFTCAGLRVDIALVLHSGDALRGAFLIDIPLEFCYTFYADVSHDEAKPFGAVSWMRGICISLFLTSTLSYEIIATESVRVTDNSVISGVKLPADSFYVLILLS